MIRHVLNLPRNADAAQRSRTSHRAESAMRRNRAARLHPRNPRIKRHAAAGDTISIDVRHPHPLRPLRRTPDAARASRTARARRGRWTPSRRRGASAGPRSSRRGRRRASSWRASTTATICVASRKRREGLAARSRHLHVARVARDRAARRRRGDRRRRAGRWAGRTVPRSRWCGRRDITPSAIARWGSACSTTSRSPRRTRARRAPRRSRSSTTTSTTATARSTSSRPIRTSSTSRRTSSRTTRAPARPTKSDRRAGRGFTVNVPLEVGAVDEDYQLVFAQVVLPVLRQFEPDLIIVSAGFDAHERDPLGGMRLSTAAFARDDAGNCAPSPKKCCRGRIVSVTEGGYDLQALAASLDAVIEAHARVRILVTVSGRRAASRRRAERTRSPRSGASTQRSGRSRRRPDAQHELDDKRRRRSPSSSILQW